MDTEDYFGFFHGMSAGVAATSVWEGLRCFLSGTALLLVGMGISAVIVHGVHWHHRKTTLHRIKHRRSR